MSDSTLGTVDRPGTVTRTDVEVTPVPRPPVVVSERASRRVEHARLRMLGGLVPLIAAAVPPLLVVRAVARNAVDVPFWDEWEIVPLLQAARHGHLTLAALWAQHNEHRLVLPRLIWFAMARLTTWNEPWALAANLVTALGTLVVLALLVRRTVRPFAPRLVPWLVFLASLLTFSLAQWENWTWGFQLQMFMNVLAAAAMAWLLSRWQGGWSGLIAPFLAALAGALSFSSGLLLLVLLPVGVLLAPIGTGLRGRAVAATTLAGMGALCIALYLVGWQHPSGHPPLSTVLGDPWSYALYVFAYLGRGFEPGDARIAAACGSAGLVLFVGCTTWLWIRSPPHRAAVLPWLLLALCAVSCAAVTGVGRVGFGVDQAMASRYVTIAALFWVSLGVIVALAGARYLQREGSRTKRIGLIAVASCAIVLVGRMYVSSWNDGMGMLEQHSAMLRLGAECVRYADVAPEACLRQLYPFPESRGRLIDGIRDLGVGPFAVTAPEPLASYAVLKGDGGFVDRVAMIGEPPLREARIVGWAVDPLERRPPKKVLVAVDGNVIAVTTPASPRPDVAKARGRRLRFSGWEARFGAFRLTSGRHLLEAYAALDDHRVVRLEGAQTFTVDEDR